MQLKDVNGATTGWTLTTAPDDEVETYDANGRLLSIKSRAGLTQTLSYSNATTPTTIAPRTGLLIKVADSFGRSLNFTYGLAGRVATLADAAGGVYRYAYDGIGRLTSVTYPDATPAVATDNPKRTYVYNESINTSGANLPYALTGIVDENGARYATYKYDITGRAISSEHAGGAEKVALSYTTDVNGNPLSTSVTDARGSVYTHSFQTVLGVVKSSGQSQPAGAGCAAASRAASFDANGNVASRTDFNGNRTNYGYDLARNLETSRTEAFGQPEQRTIKTSWHPSFRLPAKIEEWRDLPAPALLRDTSFAYDEVAKNGTLLTRRVRDAASNASRAWRATYNSLGQVLTIDGPRTDVADLTTFAYYPLADAIVNNRGQRKSATNALGEIATYASYNAHGQPGAITGPDGLVTTLGYDARQRLVSVQRGGEVTGLAYYPTGQLRQATLPSGRFVAATYNDAHQLTRLTDQSGNYIVYTRDLMGNAVLEENFTAAGVKKTTRSRVFDALNRFAVDIGAF